MTYPPAPWTLQGHSLQVLEVLDIDQVRPLIPAALEIIPVWPGKTLGVTFVAAYGSGSTLQYNELICAIALTRCLDQQHTGAWITHIYVDNPDSVAGGRQIWGLPKELAQFTWSLQGHPGVEVYQDQQLLCSLQSQWQLPGWRLPLTGYAFGGLSTDLFRFQVQTSLRLGLCGIRSEIPATSPLVAYRSSQLNLGTIGQELRLTVGDPQVVAAGVSLLPPSRTHH